MMTSQFRSGREKTRKREISRDFSRFFDPAFFSEFHRALLPFSMLCPDSDSRKGLFCVFPKAIDSVAGFGLAKAEPDSAKKPPLHKLFTNTIDPSSNCPDLNSRNWARGDPIYCPLLQQIKTNKIPLPLVWIRTHESEKSVCYQFVFWTFRYWCGIVCGYRRR